MDVLVSLESKGHLLQGTSCCRDNGFCSTNVTETLKHSTEQIVMWLSKAQHPGDKALGHFGCCEALGAVETSDKEKEKPVRVLGNGTIARTSRTWLKEEVC